MDGTLEKSWKTALDSLSDNPLEPDITQAGKPDADYLPEKVAPVLTSPEDLDIEIGEYTELRPWGRMDVETDRQYELFSYYRSLGRARMKKDVAKHFDVNPSYVTKISQQRSWDVRIENWDAYKERVYEQTVLDGIRVMGLAHADLARDALNTLMMPFEVLKDRMENGEGRLELETMPIANLIRLLNTTAKSLPGLMNAERLARGLPTEIIDASITAEGSATINMSTADELAELLNGFFDYHPGSELGDIEDANIIDVRGREILAEAPADSEAE